MTMEPYGVGIIGAGRISTEHINAFRRNPRTEVRAISSRTVEGALRKANEVGLENCVVYETVEELVESDEIDMVSICTPHHLHSEETVLAAEAGKHILIEKPAAITLDGLKEMRDAVCKAKVKTVVGFVLRWNPLIETIKGLITKEYFGDIYYAEADYLHRLGTDPGISNWIRDLKKGGTPILSGGTHAIDCIRWLSHPGMQGGAEIVEVKGFGISMRDDLEYQSSLVSIFKFRDGTMGKVALCTDCTHPYMFPLNIFGTRGAVRDNRIYSNKFKYQRDWIKIPTILPDSPEVSHHPFHAEIDHFVDCIVNDRESFVSLGDAVNTHEAAMAVDISMAEGRTVKLPLL